MIKVSILEKRLGTSIEGATLAAKAAKLTGFVGGSALYSLAIGDEFVCNSEQFDPRERTESDGRVVQSAILNNGSHIITIGTIMRKTKEGAFHPASTGMEDLLGLNLVEEAVLALENKTIVITGVHDIMLPAYQKTEDAPQRQYSFDIFDEEEVPPVVAPVTPKPRAPRK